MEEPMMSLDLYKAAVNGDVSILPNGEGIEEGATVRTSRLNEVEKYFFSCTFEERNTILHVAARNAQNLNFIAEALKRFPTLIGPKNSKGETALHVSAKQGNMDITALLVTFYGEVKASAPGNNGSEPLWRVTNLEGDTPLHIAVKRGKIQVALFLINLDDSLVSSVNNFGETPLHLAARVCTSFDASRNGFIKKLSPERGKLHEEMLQLIYLLLRKPSSAVYKRDQDGLTPLLKATCCRSCIPFILVLIDYNPQLAEQRDLNGRTLLHLMKIESHKEGKRVLEMPVITSLKDEQDFDGDTPIHSAIRNSEFMKVRVLMEFSADLTINNRCGISPWALLQSQKDFVTKMNDETDKAMNGLMEKQMYRAAVGGDAQFLSQHDDIYLLSRTTEGNNILHIALGPESIETTHFVMSVLKRFPVLLCQTNAQGDTPLHLAAKFRTSAAQELAISCKDTFQKTLESGASFPYCAPWRVRNSEGNTPIHEALRAGNATFACFLIQLDDEVASFVNNYKETPLHVYARYHQIPGPLWSSIGRQLPGFGNQAADELDLLLQANISAAFWRDLDGLTPLLRAAQCNNYEKIRRIFSCCPSSAEICDFNGRTLLHLMPLSDKTQALLEISQIKALIETRDHEGNAPLHIAIRNRQFNKVKILLKHCCKDQLDAVNNDGEAPIDLIRSQTQVPHEILELIKDMPKGVYGISEAEMKDNVHILLVIAVLLATITFAAGITPPGGFNSSTGVPVLMSKAAFKLYLISDTYAMCCSMLALFSLIWFMTGKPSESLKLIDLSVFVIQQSFYGTTLAFMTGVYAAISPQAFWTAILVCAFCCGLIVCSLKPLNLLLSRIFCLIHGFLHNAATEYAWLPCLSCLCFVLLSGSRWE